MRFSAFLRPSRAALTVLVATAAMVAPSAAGAHGHAHGAKHPFGFARVANHTRIGLADSSRAKAHRKKTSPRQNTGGLLFRGEKISDFPMNQSAPGAVSEVPDPTGSGQSVFQMTVKNSDVYPVTPTSDPRAQLLSPAIIDDGEEFWWSGSFFLPSDFPTDVPGWLTVMEGPYGEPFDGTPPWHIEVNGDSLRWQRNDTYDWDIPWEMPLVRNSWVDVTVHEKFGAEGWVEMWVNGQQSTFFAQDANNPNHEPQSTRISMATRDHSNDQGPNFTVIQSYRKAGMFGTVSLFQGPMAIGTSKAAVES